MRWIMKTRISILKVLRIIANIISIILLAVVPSIIVASNYKIFTNNATKINGWVFIFSIIILVPTLKYLGKLIEQMPDIEISGKHTGELNTCKFILKAIKRLIFPIICVVVIFLFKDDVELAFNTFIWVIVSIVASHLVEELFVSPINFVIGLDTDNAIDTARAYRKKMNKKIGTKNRAKEQ